METSLTLCKYKVVLHFSYLSFHILLKYTHICFVSVHEIFLDLFNIHCMLCTCSVCTLTITLFFTFILCSVDITGISEDQDVSLEDGNYASISVSMQEINPNFASFEGNPFQDPIERCVYYIPCSS